MRSFCQLGYYHKLKRCDNISTNSRACFFAEMRRSQEQYLFSGGRTQRRVGPRRQGRESSRNPERRRAHDRQTGFATETKAPYSGLFSFERELMITLVGFISVDAFV